jgi:hypothetical protein
MKKNESMKMMNKCRQQEEQTNPNELDHCSYSLISLSNAAVHSARYNTK